MINQAKKHIGNKKAMGWIITHSIFLGMIIALLIDYQLWPEIILYSGYLALGFFAVTLALNPLIKIAPYTWIIKLNRYRRQLGVASFSYALVHVICFIIKRCLDQKWFFFLHPGVLPVLLIGFPLLLILALTSNQYSIKKLSFVRWKKLHKTVYFAEVFIIIHLLLTGYKRLALYVFGPLIVLQFLRKRSRAKESK